MTWPWYDISLVVGKQRKKQKGQNLEMAFRFVKGLRGNLDVALGVGPVKWGSPGG